MYNLKNALKSITELNNDIDNYFNPLSKEDLKTIREGFYQMFPDSIPYKDFDKNGLRVNVSFLSKIQTTIALWLPPQISCDYCDVVTFENAKNPDYNFVAVYQFERMNATSIGNLAYLSLYAMNEQTKLLARETLKAVVLQILKMTELEILKMN